MSLHASGGSGIFFKSRRVAAMKSCTSVRAMMSGVFISLVTMCACAPLNSEREDGRSYTPPPKPKQTTTVKADTSGQNGPVIGPPLPPSYKTGKPQAQSRNTRAESGEGLLWEGGLYRQSAARPADGQWRALRPHQIYCRPYFFAVWHHLPGNQPGQRKDRQCADQ